MVSPSTVIKTFAEHLSKAGGKRQDRRLKKAQQQNYSDFLY
jgi:hypothetical protein